MDRDLLMGLDNGGSMTKCVIFDAKGRELAHAGRRLPLITPAPGLVERDLELVWRENAALIRETLELAGASGEEIAAIGLTGYGNGLCLVDAQGNPTCNGVVSTDNRGQGIVNESRAAGLEEAVFKLNHQGLWSAQTSTLLAWFARNRPEVLRASRWLLSIKDYIRMRLTGEAYCDVTEASSAGLMNLHTLRFDPELFRLLGIEAYMHLMPPCLEVTQPGGCVSRAAAELTGLREGTPIGGSCFDVDAGMLASGILDMDTLCLIAGTWSINEHLTDKLRYGYNESTNAVSMSFLPGRYLVEESTPTSAGNFEWFVEQFLEVDRPGIDKRALYRECDAQVAALAPEDSDVVFVPFLFSSATHPDAKAAFFNLSGYHGRAHVVRAIYEGVVFSSVFHVGRLTADGRSFRGARLSGGLTNSPVWTQMMADALGMPVEVPEASELSALGAAMCAGVGAGLFRDCADAAARMVRVGKTYRPDPEQTARYAEKFAAYQRALAALEVFHG